MASELQGCILDGFLTKETPKTRKDTTWSVPSVFLSDSWCAPLIVQECPIYIHSSSNFPFGHRKQVP